MYGAGDLGDNSENLAHDMWQPAVTVHNRWLPRVGHGLIHSGPQSLKKTKIQEASFLAVLFNCGRVFS